MALKSFHKLNSCKKPRLKGPMDSFTYNKPEKVCQLRKQGKLKQGKYQRCIWQEEREDECQYISWFFYNFI